MQGISTQFRNPETGQPRCVRISMDASAFSEQYDGTLSFYPERQASKLDFDIELDNPAFIQIGGRRNRDSSY